MLLSVSADRQICEGFSKKDALKTQSDWNIPVTVQEKKKKRGLREKLCLLTCILSLTVSGLSCRRCYCC